MLGLPLERTAVEEGSAFGAALLGGVAAGVFASAEEAVAACVRVRDAVEPDPAWSAAYGRPMAATGRLYPALTTILPAERPSSSPPGSSRSTRSTRRSFRPAVARRRSASVLAEWLEQAGLEVHVEEAAPGRPNVIGIARGTGGGRSLILNGHLDTVGLLEPDAVWRPASRTAACTAEAPTT